MVYLPGLYLTGWEIPGLYLTGWEIPGLYLLCYTLVIHILVYTSPSIHPGYTSCIAWCLLARYSMALGYPAGMREALGSALGIIRRREALGSLLARRV